jgi:hypothetical protein
LQEKTRTFLMEERRKICYDKEKITREEAE